MSSLELSRIKQAFLAVDRADFLPSSKKKLAHLDQALPIGYKQTISQPSVVYFMFILLQPSAGQNILDVGSGSGWTTAMLAWLVGPTGKVWAMEIIPALKKMGEKNVAKCRAIKQGIVKFILGDGSQGYPAAAPFDRILVSASADKVPPALKRQLKIGGRMVIPVGNNIDLIVRKGEKDFKTISYPGFAFVPLQVRSQS